MNHDYKYEGMPDADYRALVPYIRHSTPKQSTMEEEGRVKLLKLDDEATPYIFELKTDDGIFTATPACAEGEGAIEDQELTNDELAFVRHACAEIERKMEEDAQ